MTASLAVWAIGQYRKRISPIKGFKCAYGQARGRATCSGVGLRAFGKAGWIKGFALLRRQLDRCVVSAWDLNSARALEAQNGSYRRLARMGAGRGEGGFVDCGGCDAPSCDMPSCDMPSCDMPSCDMPSCDMPSPPSCEAPSLPSFRLPPALACESGGGSWLEALYCLDCSDCVGSRSGSAARVEQAKSRLGAAADARSRRRVGSNGEKKPGEPGFAEDGDGKGEASGADAAGDDGGLAPGEQPR